MRMTNKMTDENKTKWINEIKGCSKDKLSLTWEPSRALPDKLSSLLAPSDGDLGKLPELFLQ